MFSIRVIQFMKKVFHKRKSALRKTIFVNNSSPVMKKVFYNRKVLLRKIFSINDLRKKFSMMNSFFYKKKLSTTMFFKNLTKNDFSNSKKKNHLLHQTTSQYLIRCNVSPNKSIKLYLYSNQTNVSQKKKENEDLILKISLVLQSSPLLICRHPTPPHRSAAQPSPFIIPVVGSPPLPTNTLI